MLYASWFIAIAYIFAVIERVIRGSSFANATKHQCIEIRMEDSSDSKGGDGSWFLEIDSGGNLKKIYK